MHHHWCQQQTLKLWAWQSHYDNYVNAVGTSDDAPMDAFYVTYVYENLNNATMSTKTAQSIINPGTKDEDEHNYSRENTKALVLNFLMKKSNF